jgi:hypothetical protein
MKISYIQCDSCEIRENLEPQTYGGYPRNWIEVRIPLSRSENKLPAGVSHFCSENCLREKLSCASGLPNKANMASGPI